MSNDKAEVTSGIVDNTDEKKSLSANTPKADPAEAKSITSEKPKKECKEIKKSDFYLFGTFAGFFIAAFLPFICAILNPNTFIHNRIFFGFIVMVSLGGACVLLGKNLTGCWKGILIDRRNMISLSKLQMLIWTILIISGFITIAAYKMANPTISNPLDIGVPETLWALMGISTAAFVGSPIIKGDQTKKEISPESKKKLVLENGQDVQGSAIVNQCPEDASFFDLFQGEQVGNFAGPDLGKIQMFIFTLITWGAYFLLLYQLINRFDHTDVEQFVQNQVLFSQTTNTTLQQLYQQKMTMFDLPDISGGLTGLLAISNAGYLTYKAIPRSGEDS